MSNKIEKARSFISSKGEKVDSKGFLDKVQSTKGTKQSFSNSDNLNEMIEDTAALSAKQASQLAQSAEELREIISRSKEISLEQAERKATVATKIAGNINDAKKYLETINNTDDSSPAQHDKKSKAIQEMTKLLDEATDLANQQAERSLVEVESLDVENVSSAQELADVIVETKEIAIEQAKQKAKEAKDLVDKISATKELATKEIKDS